MSSIVLSVIIPIYNAGSYLAECLDSIASQTDNLPEDSLEVICVDDGSKDGSLSILNKYATDHGYIRTLHQKNMGPAAARNAGLNLAGGEWVWFIDPDDHVAQDSLNTVLCVVRSENADVCIFDAYEHKTDAGVGGRPGKDKICPWEHFSEDHVFTDKEDICAMQRLILYPFVAGREAKIFSLKGMKAYSTPFAAPWDKLYRRQFLTDNGLRFNESLRVLDDMVFNMQVFGAAGRVAYSTKKIYHYVRNTGSITAAYTPDRIKKDRAVWKAIKEYADGAERGKSELRKAINKRIIKSFAIALKLDIFNPIDPASTYDQLQEAGRVLALPEYKEAFGSVKLKEIEWRLRPVIMCVKIGWMRGLRLLTKMQEKI